MARCSVAVVLLSLVVSVGRAVASGATCDAGAARTDCGKWRPRRRVARANVVGCCSLHAGYVGIDAAECEKKGCCWNPAEVSVAADLMHDTCSQRSCLGSMNEMFSSMINNYAERAVVLFQSWPLALS